MQAPRASFGSLSAHWRTMWQTTLRRTTRKSPGPASPRRVLRVGGRNSGGTTSSMMSRRPSSTLPQTCRLPPPPHPRLRPTVRPCRIDADRGGRASRGDPASRGDRAGCGNPDLRHRRGRAVGAQTAGAAAHAGPGVRVAIGMPNSWAFPAPGTCGDCGAVTEHPIWMIIDIEERPDLEQLVRDDRLRVGPCPSCQATLPLRAAILLLYRPRREPALLMGIPAGDEPVAKVSCTISSASPLSCSTWTPNLSSSMWYLR